LVPTPQERKWVDSVPHPGLTLPSPRFLYKGRSGIRALSAGDGDETPPGVVAVEMAMDRPTGHFLWIIAGAGAAGCVALGSAVALLRTAPESVAAGAAIIAALLILFALFAFVMERLLRELKRRAKAERAEDESAAQYRLLADHSSDMIVLINLTDRTRRYVSPSCRQLFGYEPEELTGKSIQSMIHPDDLPLLWKGEEDFKRTGRAIITSRNRRKDGKYIWAETTWERVINSRNGQLELVAVARDVTERVEAQEAMRSAIAEAETARHRADSANQAKSQFLANMSHEIRTPINGIMGMSHLLGETPLSEEQRGYAQSIMGCGTALLSIINDILDLSKLEAGGMVLESAPFDPSALVDSVVGMFEPLARDKAIALSAAIEPVLHGTYLGDPTRLRQALTNLVANALKFTEAGSIRIEASLTGTNGDGATLRFAVSDTGIGIAAAALPAIFQKFQQADPSITRKYGGTGLGLAITKQIVELMGGSIAVSSREGAGSRFWFDLPLRRAASAMPEPEPDLDAAPLSRGGRKLRVLLVEDNAVNQRVAQLILGKAGHAVETVDNGRAAIAAVRAAAFDAVLMDIQMSDMDGIQATQHIRALPPPLGTVPIIALTANALAGARDEYLAAGMNGYVSKPFRPAALLATLDRAAARGAAAEPVGETAPEAAARRFDPTRLEEIRSMTDKASFGEMVDEFARRLEARLARLGQLVERSDWVDAAREAHDVGSVAGTVGAARLSSLARELEAMCKSRSTECRSTMRRIADEAGGALKELKAYRAAA